jgi:hypothetical protein
MPGTELNHPPKCRRSCLINRQTYKHGCLGRFKEHNFVLGLIGIFDTGGPFEFQTKFLARVTAILTGLTIFAMPTNHTRLSM